MNNLKFELIIAYYKRPKIVLNALESILKTSYDNWHLTFVDDSGDDSFKETFLNFGLDKSKINYVPILMSDDEKIKIGGSIFGKYVNDAIQNTDADIIILICDDDALFPDYLENLNKFYTENSDIMWGYSHVKFFNPETQHYLESTDVPSDKTFNTSNLNNYTSPIQPSCRVDSSQVSFRKEAFTQTKLWYPYPHTKDLDRNVFEKLYKKIGLCYFTNCYGQYKGWFENQLGVRARRGNGDFIN
jgi:glycosyltransferase involved in cell wall biosynthesis